MINKLKINRNIVFVCQLSDSFLKVARFSLGRDLRKKIIGLDVENFAQDINDSDLADKLNQFFKKIGYNNNPLIISLPRNQVTCRFLKVPSIVPAEIEKIVSLQSARYLPYPPEELITGFQIISIEKDGSSYINQIIVHKDVVERYIKIFGQVKAAKLNIILSSYGLCNLYDYVNLRENIPVMVIDVDSNLAEVIVVDNKKLIFSRSFKLSRNKADWQGVFIAEINKTQDAFLKEVARKAPLKIILLGRKSVQFKDILEKQISLPVEILSYEEKTGLTKEVLNNMVNLDVSFNSLIGLGLKSIDGYLSLLTKELKQQVNAFSKTKEHLRLAALFAVIILMFTLGIIRDFNNRDRYLNLLKNELAKINREARELESIDKRFKFLESRAKKKATSLAFISEISQVMPQKVFLSNLNYEENNQLVLRGQAYELNSVFIFALQLEKVPSLKNFNIKVRYATKRKTQQQEIVDFEIVCLEKAALKKAKEGIGSYVIEEDID